MPAQLIGDLQVLMKDGSIDVKVGRNPPLKLGRDCPSLFVIVVGSFWAWD
jgi:hypothetical protein